MQIRFFLFLLLMASVLSSRCQEVLSPLCDGSMRLYPLDENEPLSSVATDSLRPVMINYIARHGARYLSSSDKTSELKSILTKAANAGKLTSAGAEFMHLLDRIDAETAGRWGALDSLGIVEETMLAAQMHDLAPSLLNSGKLTAISSYVPRVVMSMYEFCHTLCRLSPSIEITASEGKQYNRLLRFFTTDSAYVHYLKDGAWKAVYESYVAATIPSEPARKLIGDYFGTNINQYRTMTMSIYGVLQSMRATSMPSASTRWMSNREYELCWRAANLQHCLQRTATQLGTLPDQSAQPLLQSLIASLDSAATPHSPKAFLRFGHAETLMPLFSLMRLPGCYVPDGTPFDSIYHVWRDYEVVPLGANLLIISLRSPSGRIYVSMRLNGKWISPLNDHELIAPWDKLRNFWLSKLR